MERVNVELKKGGKTMSYPNIFRMEKEWSELSQHDKQKLIERLLTYHEASEFVQKFLLEREPWLVEKMMVKFLEQRHFFRTLGCYWEQAGRGDFYAPEIVKAAESYEKACMFEKALELYQKGEEVCSPSRIDVYDEKTGGYVSASHYPELNRELLEEAERLVEKCKEKIKELKAKKVKEVKI